MKLTEEIELLEKKVELLKQVVEMQEMIADYEKAKPPQYVPIPQPIYHLIPQPYWFRVGDWPIYEQPLITWSSRGTALGASVGSIERTQ